MLFPRAAVRPNVDHYVVHPIATRGSIMAKNRHTFAKRQREVEKKRKAEEKRLKKHKTPQPNDTMGLYNG
jgi:hypothetical protein